MKIERIKGRNFLALSEFDIAMADQGLVAIMGENLADSSASSNGSGKSSIVDALQWAIYGDTARGYSGDEVVNNQAGKDCEVFVSVVDGDQNYRITRHRKHKVHKNEVCVTKLDMATGTVSILTKGTNDLTQAEIDRIMGCSLEVFSKSVYLPQESMPDLPAMTDKQLKLLIEEAAGIDRLSAAHDVAKKRLSAVQSEAAVLKSRIEACDRAIQNHKSNIAQYEDSFREFEDDRLKQASALYISIQSLKDEEDRLNKEAAGLDKPGLLGKKSKVESRLSGLKAEQDRLEGYDAAIRALELEEATLRSRHAMASQEFRRRLDALKNIESRVGEPCGECGKPYCAHDLDDASKIERARVDESKHDIQAIKTQHSEVAGKLSESRVEREEFKSAMSDATKLNRALQTISERLSDIRVLEVNAGTAKYKREEAEKRRADTLSAANSYAAMLARERKAHDDRAEEMDVLEGELEALKAKLALHERAVEVFGVAGVRAHVLDSVTPYLNARTGEYLGALSDGNISAVWSTLGATKKGELREKFNIAVAKTNGASDFKGLSGGEKRKARLACAMALQDLVATRAVKPIDLLCMDEVDLALDEAGLERLMALLEEKSRKHGSLFVISHQSLKDHCDNVLMVRNRGGMSVVERES